MGIQLIAALKAVGFTANESKAYLTLLQKNPATGYEISGRSGIPRSAIYEILKRLETMGVVSLIDTNPARYIPLPPEQLFEHLEAEFRHNLENLKQSLQNINSQWEAGDLWNIRGYENMISRARAMLQKASESVYLSIWEDEYERLLPFLEECEARGVNLVVFSFCSLPKIVGQVYSYNLASESLKRIWSRKILLVVDRKEALLGGVENLPGNKVAWTKNAAIVSIALNYIILDLTLFGQRFHLDLSKVISGMLEGDIQALDKLLDEQHRPIFPPGLQRNA